MVVGSNPVAARCQPSGDGSTGWKREYPQQADPGLAFAVFAKAKSKSAHFPQDADPPSSALLAIILPQFAKDLHKLSIQHPRGWSGFITIHLLGWQVATGGVCLAHSEKIADPRHPTPPPSTPDKESID